MYLPTLQTERNEDQHTTVTTMNLDNMAQWKLVLYFGCFALPVRYRSGVKSKNRA